MLTCGCGELDFEPGDVNYFFPEDFEKLESKRRKRCTSCGELIDVGSFVIAFNWFKVPEHEIEINIYGEDGEIPRAKTYMCETCGEIHLNLLAIGYCVSYNEDMREALKEYHKIVASNPQKAS